MSKNIELLGKLPDNRPPVKAVIFDFDGTISTLRQGWEEIMEPLMVEMITGNKPASEELVKAVRDFINESTGIQTIYQMEWLENEVRRRKLNPVVHDKWWYKDEYNRRLLDVVNARIEKLDRGELDPGDYLIKGGRELLQALHSMKLDLYIASGTDEKDVVNEVRVLGLLDYFTKVAGAPERRADCSKEAVIRMLMHERGLQGAELLVIGDGKVEIRLGVEAGAITLGVASDEIRREGVNPVKRERLIKAGANAIVGDFTCADEIIALLL
ncbi:MAG TPA: HAD family hydrolase [Candidatus Atribacteria bacterium]|nr:HAD family hydrolase [Candidatus Atribacteria bacterium]HPT78915.1 HAD family hydrolase [Candidatus Atribacteria bacterium]